MGSYRALLIGNSSFPADEHNLRPLAGPVNDVAVLRAALADPAVGLFEPESVRLVPERTAQEIREELDRFFQSARRDDTLLLYYSGHGLLDEHNQLFLCARDTRTNFPESTAVGAAHINLMFEKSAARTTVIVLDCCHSGAFKSGNLADSLRGSGRFLLTSCRSGDLTPDATRENTTSIFTNHLVDGLLRGARDSDRDGYVDLSDLYDYVYERLSAEGRQIPQRSFAGGGDIAISKRLPTAIDGEPPASPLPPKGGFELSTTTIDLGEVRSDDPLVPEHVFVTTEDDRQVDWVAATAEDWITVEPHDGFFTLTFQPRPGLNRGRVVVRERAGGPSRVLRVTLRVTEVPTPTPPTPLPPPAPLAPTPADASDQRPRPKPRIAALVAAGAVVVVAIAVVIAAAGGGGGGGTATPSTAGSGDVTNVAVGGAQAWKPALHVAAGQNVVVESSGTIIHDVGRNRSAGPDGDSSPDLQQYNVVVDMPHGGLIGKVGESGRPFALGARKEFTSTATGTLYLQVNDVGLDTNGGEFQVTVRAR